MKSAPRNLPIRARRPRRNRLPDNLPAIAQPELRRAIAEHRAIGRAARVTAAGRGGHRGGGGGGGGRGLGSCRFGSCGLGGCRGGGCHGGVGERGGYGHERRHGRGRFDGRGAGGAGREDAAWVAGWDGRGGGGLDGEGPDGGGLDNGSRGLDGRGGGRAAGCGCAAAACDGFAAASTGRGLVLGGRFVGDDVLAGVGEQHVGVWRALAVDRGDVGDEHVRQLVELGCVASAAGNRDGGAVHIQLRSAAQSGKPSPREGDLPVRDAVWDLEAEIFGPVDAWAASFHGHDNLELGVGSWDLVSCDAELAASPSVNCGTLKRETLSISNFHVVHL